LALEKSPTLDKLIQLTRFGTIEEKADAARLLGAVRTAAKNGIRKVPPDLQRTVVDLLPRLMSKKDANTVIYKGLVEVGFAHPDTIVAVPEAPARKATLIELGKLMSFGTAKEKDEGARLMNAIVLAQQRGLNVVPPQLQRTVIGWLEPLFGKKEADRILSR
jgi:hypothetical protein